MNSLLDLWKCTSLPAVVVEDWDSSSAFLALAQIKRLRGQLAAAQALFTTQIEPVTGRDTRETLCRELGLSSAEAAKAQRAASVVARAPQAAALLASGSVSTEHLARLASIDDNADVSALLADAMNESPDEFGRTVDRFRITKDAKGCRDRALQARTLTFFDTEFGFVASSPRWKAVVSGCSSMRSVTPTGASPIPNEPRRSVGTTKNLAIVGWRMHRSLTLMMVGSSSEGRI